MSVARMAITPHTKRKKKMETITELLAGLALLLLFTTIALAIELNTTLKTVKQYRRHASRLVRKEYTTRDTLTAVIDTLTIERDDALVSVEAYRVYCSRLIRAHNKKIETLNEARSNEAHLAYALLECAIDECDNTTSLVVCDECTDEMTGHYESVRER